MKDYDWKPYSVQFLYCDNIHGFVQLNVVELKSCVDPCQAKTKLELKNLLDFFYLLNHHDIHTDEEKGFNMSHDMFKPCNNREFFQPKGWRWGLVLQILFFVKGDSPTVLLVAAVVTVLFMGS